LADSEAEVKDVIAAYNDGVAIPDLVRQYGVCKNTLFVHLKPAGVTPTRRANLTAAATTEAAELYVSGLSLAALAKRFGRNPDTVRKAFVEVGVTIRRAGGRRRPQY
jgi:hypothetical protein